MSSDPRHELDIVRENRGLTFPSAPELKFLFWWHGSGSVADLVPHLADVNPILLEFSGETWPVEEEPRHSKSQAYFAKLNAVTAEDANIKARDTLTRNNSYSQLTFELAGNGQTFIPIDTIAATRDELARAKFLGSKATQSDADKVAYIAYRDSIDLRQIASIAREYYDAEKIGIVMGAGHRMLAPAAKQLGATVSRVFIHPPQYELTEVKSIMKSLVRWGHYASFEDIPAEDREIAKIGHDIEFLLMPQFSSGHQAVSLLHRLKRIYQSPEDWEELTQLITSIGLDLYKAHKPLITHPLRRQTQKKITAKLEDLKGYL